MVTAIYLFAATLSVVAMAVGIAGIAGTTWTLSSPWLVPLTGLELSLDRLSGFFLVLIGGTAFPVSIYAIGYARTVRRGLFSYIVFLVSMCLVPLASNVLTFLLVWELMSIASYLLVFTAEEKGADGAAWVYAIMTHIGFACLLSGMFLLGGWTESLRFADWRALAHTLPPGAKNIAFVLLALGFAGKAGIIPLHVWLPRAHPAAPSHVSALMSGVMIKLGVYGLLRIAFDWLGTGPAWWGIVILLAGSLSAVVGVLYALVDHDLKRLLAFHSIENVGIILIGLGTGMIAHWAGRDALALLGVMAALYHTANHAAFKALLFLGAGAVSHSTGTRNMEEMGGLIKRMPWTAACFLVGSMAIAALPPLNGFVSEWLTFQALLQGLSIPRPELNLVFVFGIAGLALTAGLAMACFVKAFGITFLALPRSDAAARAHEVVPSMRAGMLALAGVCVALGLGQTFVIPVLTSIAATLLDASATPVAGDWLTAQVSGGFASLSTLAVAGGLAGMLVIPLVALWVAGVGRRRRWYETWGCGRLLQTPRMEYTATAFANPFKRVFDYFYRPVKRLTIEFHPESRFFVQKIVYENPTRSIFEEWIYGPVLLLLRHTAIRARAIQSGSSALYLMYILAVLLLMLVLA